MNNNKNNISLGKFGEQLAADFLVRHGYKIIDGHWQKRVGEIDIVAHDAGHDEIVFVEVKTRRNTHFGFPEEKVTPKKLEKIKKTAQWFMLQSPYEPTQAWRIDVISILIPSSEKAEITHFKNISFQ